MIPRAIQEVLTAKETLEGAGVRLHRGFGFLEVPRFDPFLLFDDFSSPNPADYLPGFPWHPHRGIETVTYMLDGAVRHRDSIGNSGVITGGDIQWMTAGRGIIHEEMPEGTGQLMGFQLWVNLPRADKMTTPKYQDAGGHSIPETTHEGAKVRIVAGEVGGVRGPIEDLAIAPAYIDVTLAPHTAFTYPVPVGHTAFAYVFDGAIGAGDADAPINASGGTIVHFASEGEGVSLKAGTSGARFLLVSGRPIGEPVAWRGPIVMNTDAELSTAFSDLRGGTFLSRGT
ncbi:MAG TPA: pirin family protein [Candidatus Paceibacterota bacterium]|nr:pirin family protein [Candidatus Paceibacterota bacterium]